MGCGHTVVLGLMCALRNDADDDDVRPRDGHRGRVRARRLARRKCRRARAGALKVGVASHTSQLEKDPRRSKQHTENKQTSTQRCQPFMSMEAKVRNGARFR